MDYGDVAAENHSPIGAISNEKQIAKGQFSTAKKLLKTTPENASPAENTQKKLAENAEKTSTENTSSAENSD